ncbi:hypothetical protein [Ferruginibacter sp. HRS2-29]|uniref:DoxX family protein n=1 Tax=Ferruginibacter sp. HRS2-29 TaxID=2487334 RepID=UPI0020CBCDC1|nr:hypothetical protein [Ferruginibacter sp. HRS2-29]MCP9751596.1 hypothetical protein [Ferruginibacter sp. HRS2-29]
MTTKVSSSPTKAQNIFRILLGLLLIFAGTSHLTIARITFRAQVPGWVPLDPDLVVVLSGIVEILLGLGLLLLSKYRKQMGWITALYFLAIFPGNLNQYLNHDPAFGLDSDALRLVRLFLHPLLIIWPLWSTRAWKKG